MLVSPSVISADLTALRDQIEECDKSSPFSYHIDIMDGHFVENIMSGPDFTKALRKCTDTNLECHLMIDRPDKYYRKFMDAGANTIMVHVESPMSVGKLFRELSANGIDYGVVINPETPLENALPYVHDASILLIMSVHPGFSGQKFIPEVLDKLTTAKNYIQENELKTLIEIDGGITDVTGKLAKEAGADILASASYIFGGEIGKRMEKLKNL